MIGNFYKVVIAMIDLAVMQISTYEKQSCPTFSSKHWLQLSFEHFCSQLAH